MDLNDRLLHWILWFGGMIVASSLHHFADAIGWDTVKIVKRIFKGAGKKIDEEIQKATDAKKE